MSEAKVLLPQLSVTAGSAQVTTAPQASRSLVWEMPAICAMDGASSSVTVTSKEVCTLLPAASVAV